VKVTQNWSFEFVKIEWCCSGPDFECCFSAFWWTKIGGRMEEFGPEFAGRKYNRIVFLDSDLFQFYQGYFYYKYRLCIRVNLEIEGLKTRV